MRESELLRAIYALNARADLTHSQIADKLADPRLERLELDDLLRQQSTLAKLKERIALLRYADANDVPPLPSGDLERIVNEFDTLRRQPSAHGNVETHEAIEQIERDVFGIIHPMEITGKWPPDGAAR